MGHLNIRAVQISWWFDFRDADFIEPAHAATRFCETGLRGLIGMGWFIRFASQEGFERPQGALQIPPLRSPGFPVESRGAEEEHTALSAESRTRGRR
jgi:hypothetical protein